MPQREQAFREGRYEDEMGEESRRRQQAEARDRFLCCGERKPDGHHERCSRRPKDLGPPPGQLELG